MSLRLFFCFFALLDWGCSYWIMVMKINTIVIEFVYLFVCVQDESISTQKNETYYWITKSEWMELWMAPIAGCDQRLWSDTHTHTQTRCEYRTCCGSILISILPIWYAYDLVSSKQNETKPIHTPIILFDSFSGQSKWAENLYIDNPIGYDLIQIFDWDKTTDGRQYWFNTNGSNGSDDGSGELNYT